MVSERPLHGTRHGRSQFPVEHVQHVAGRPPSLEMQIALRAGKGVQQFAFLINQQAGRHELGENRVVAGDQAGIAAALWMGPWL